MNTKRIVIPTDFSEASLLAVAAHAQLARQNGADLWVHVMEFPTGARSVRIRWTKDQD